MATYTLTLLDTTGIQRYIFGSNVLRENIGASELVWRTTRLWPFEIINQKNWTNVKRGKLLGDLDELDDTLQIETHNLDAEVIYAGGGNCAILFASDDNAKEFVTRLSRQVLSQAPGLELIVAHVKVNWKKDALAEKMKEALEELDKQKLARRVSTPLLGVGTTVACRSTGLPAVGTNADESNLKPDKAPVRTLSASILAKLRASKKANMRLEKLLGPEGSPFKQEGVGLTIPYQLDHFGRTSGEISYIAVFHADGNGMGKRIEALRQDFPNPQDNRLYIQTMRDFSRAVEGAAKKALNKLGNLLLRHWQPDTDTLTGIAQQEDGTISEIGEIEFSQDKEHTYIPFRPLVFGGDDLTFVTDGRLGLALAAAYLEAFETAIKDEQEKEQEQEQSNTAKTKKGIAKYIKGLQACAGVAVVKAHYPFSRAYELSEALCNHAKEQSKREHSALDWHFAASGLFGKIKQIRERQYKTPAGDLEMRPLSLHRSSYLGQRWRSWPAFAQVAKTFLLDKPWRDKRNKVIALRQALRDGPKAVEQFRAIYELKELPMLDSSNSALQTTGWDGNKHCGYFDAIEALDFFLPLEG